MDAVETVKIKHPDGYAVINKSDFVEGEHELLESEGEPSEVGKGPRGKWYVKKGSERIAGPFETEDEARAAMQPDDAVEQGSE